MRRRVCTQTAALTNKPNLAKNNRKGNRCFQLKCQRRPGSRVLTWCGCSGPRTTGRDRIWKSVCILPRPRCHVRHWPDLAINTLAVPGVLRTDADARGKLEVVKQSNGSHWVLRGSPDAPEHSQGRKRSRPVYLWLLASLFPGPPFPTLLQRKLHRRIHRPWEWEKGERKDVCMCWGWRSSLTVVWWFGDWRGIVPYWAVLRGYSWFGAQRITLGLGDLMGIKPWLALCEPVPVLIKIILSNRLCCLSAVFPFPLIFLLCP